MLASLIEKVKSSTIYCLYKTNKTVCLTVLGLILWIILFFCFPALISSDGGNLFVKEYLGKLSFVNVAQKISGFESKIPDLSVSATSLSLTKLLLSVTLKGILFSIVMTVCSILFGFTRLADKKTSRSAWIDAMEKVMDSFSYKLCEGFAVLLTAIISQMVTARITDVWEGLSASLTALQEAAVSVIIFTVVFLAYSLFFAYREKRAVEVGILKTYLINIIPEIISIFIIDMLCFAIYTSYVQNGASLFYTIIFLFLVIWTAIESDIKKLFARLFLFLTSKKINTNISIVDALFWFISVMLVLFAVYISLIIMSVGPQKGGWLYMPLLQGVLHGMPLEDALITEQADVGAVLLRLTAIALFATCMLKRTPVRNSFVWVFVWPIAVLVVSLYVETELNYLFYNYKELMCFLMLFLLVFLLANDFYLVLISISSTICLLLTYSAMPMSGISMMTEDYVSIVYTSIPYVWGEVALIILTAVVQHLRRIPK